MPYYLKINEIICHRASSGGAGNDDLYLEVSSDLMPRFSIILPKCKDADGKSAPDNDFSYDINEGDICNLTTYSGNSTGNLVWVIDGANMIFPFWDTITVNLWDYDGSGKGGREQTDGGDDDLCLRWSWNRSKKVVNGLPFPEKYPSNKVNGAYYELETEQGVIN